MPKHTVENAERFAEGDHTFRSGKVNDVSIRLEHVNLLNGLNWLNIELLEGCLQLLVVHSGALVNLLDLSSWSAFSTVHEYVSMSRPPASPPFSHNSIRDSLIVFRDACREVATYPKDGVLAVNRSC